jgi:hypothetical protein
VWSRTNALNSHRNRPKAFSGRFKFNSKAALAPLACLIECPLH